MYANGTCINLLVYHSLTPSLLFIDGDDKTQYEWALSHSNALIILVKGAPFELMKQTGKVLYFDSQGALVHQLGIQSIPAKVNRCHKRLKIEELVL